MRRQCVYSKTAKLNQCSSAISLALQPLSEHSFIYMTRQSLEQQLLTQRSKRDALDQKIKHLQIAKARQDRKEQTQRVKLVGEVIYQLIALGEWSEDDVRNLVEPHLTKPTHRKLFGLDSLKSDRVSEAKRRAVKSTSVFTPKASPTPRKSVTTAKTPILPESKTQAELAAEFNQE